MTLTTHATMGGFLGAAVGNPALGFALGFLSHLLVDIIPHGDSGIADNFFVHKRRRKHAVAYVTVDATIAILFTLFLVNTKSIGSLEAFSWGVAGGVLPDLLVGLHDLTKTRLLDWFFRFHFFFHNLILKRRGDVRLSYAILAQIIFVLIIQSWL